MHLIHRSSGTVFRRATSRRPLTSNYKGFRTFVKLDLPRFCRHISSSSYRTSVTIGTWP